MRMTLMAGLIALATATVPACGAAVAQDFRSGLSAYNSGDYTRAFHDWLGLAEQGDPAAEAGIGFLFHKGLGVTQDDAQAAAWFVKAAEQGQAEAQLLLGRCSSSAGACRKAMSVRSPGVTSQRRTDSRMLRSAAMSRWST